MRKNGQISWREIITGYLLLRALLPLSLAYVLAELFIWIGWEDDLAINLVVCLILGGIAGFFYFLYVMVLKITTVSKPKT